MSWRRKESRVADCLYGTDAGDIAEAVRLLERCGFCIRTESRQEGYDLYGTWTAEGFGALCEIAEGSERSLAEVLAVMEPPFEGAAVKSRVCFGKNGGVSIYLDRR